MKNLFIDLQDGTILLSLLEALLGGPKLVRTLSIMLQTGHNLTSWWGRGRGGGGEGGGKRKGNVLTFVLLLKEKSLGFVRSMKRSQRKICVGQGSPKSYFEYHCTILALQAISLNNFKSKVSYHNF